MNCLHSNLSKCAMYGKNEYLFENCNNKPKIKSLKNKVIAYLSHNEPLIKKVCKTQCHFMFIFVLNVLM
jgi:hypothetical protein